MTALTLQIAPQLAATLPHVARQAFRPKTGSLFRGSEQGLIVVSKKQGRTGLGISFADDESKTHSTYRMRESLREIHATHSRSIVTFYRGHQ